VSTRDSSDGFSLEAFKAKLSKLETHLKSLLESSSEELHIAKELQKLLHPNRLEKVPGIECLARYISAQDLSCEGFDFLTPKGPHPRESWFVGSWSETFGMSSLLIQTLIKLQSEFTVNRGSPLGPEEFFNSLLASLEGARKKGRVRLLVARLNHHSLKWEGRSVGFAPFLIRRPTPATGFGSWEWTDLRGVQASKDQEKLLAPQTTAEAPKFAWNFDFTLSPGARLAFLSPGWAQTESFSEYEKLLWKNLENSKKKNTLSPTNTLVDDLNALLIEAEDFLKSKKVERDISAVVWQVSPTKLHLA
jgi:hypothetical protein